MDSVILFQYSYLFSYILSAWLSFTLFQVLARAATGFIEFYAQRNENIPQTSLLPNIVNVVIYALGILLILSAMGISVAPLLTAMGIGYIIRKPCPVPVFIS